MTHITDNGNNNYSIADNNKGMSHKPLEPEKRNITDIFMVGRNAMTVISEKSKNLSYEKQFSWRRQRFWHLFYSSRFCFCHSKLMVMLWQTSLYFHFFLTKHKGWGIPHSCCVSYNQEHRSIIAMTKLVFQRTDKIHLTESCSAQWCLENWIAVWAPNPLKLSSSFAARPKCVIM